MSLAQAQARAILALAEQMLNDGQQAQALQLVDQALERDESPAGRFMRARALKALGRTADALQECDFALTYAAQDVSIHACRAELLRAQGRFDDAMAAADRALALNPRHAHALLVRSLLLLDIGLPLAAREGLAIGQAIHPDDIQMQWADALLQLQMGDFARGWAGYELRWRNPFLRKGKPLPGTLWTGEALGKERTLLLQCEQGFGDTMQFCRLVGAAARSSGARIVLVVPRPLRQLLAQLGGVDVLLDTDDPLPAYDCWCPLMSLPHALGLQAPPPWQGPYLEAPAASVATWRARLPATQAPRVALVWSGNPQHQGDSRRSMGLVDLLGALPLGPQYVSLQQKLRPGERELLAARTDIVEAGSTLDDFTDTAALCAIADLVIAVDTGVAHLAGAMGRPTWVALPFAPDWRWQRDRSDSPWYPSMQLFRQDKPLDWSSMLRRLGLELQAWLGRHGL